MSLIKSIRKQLGLSVTPANNFTLDASADDGTMKLARGNAGVTTQDILTVDAAGKVAFPQNVQTWQNMSASRVAATTYTNATGQPIQCAVTSWNNSAVGYFTITVVVAGINLLLLTTETAVTQINTPVVFTVPAGASYSVTVAGNNSPAIVLWMELR